MIPDHGTYARYVSKSHKCRCRLCRAANTAYQRHRRNGGVVPLAQREQMHGDRNTYMRGCRCRPCKDAQAAYKRAWKAKRKALTP